MNPETQSTTPDTSSQPPSSEIPPQSNIPISGNNKKPKNRKIIIGLVLLLVIAIAAFIIPAGNSSNDETTSKPNPASTQNNAQNLVMYDNKYFSVKYPDNFDKEELPASVSTTQVASFSEKNYGDGNIIAGAEATTSAAFSKDIKDYQDFINQNALGQKVVEQNLTETTLGGVKGPELTWTTQDGTDVNSQKKFIYIQSKKDGELYSLSISYMSTNTTFEQQIPDIIKSFSIK